MNKEIAIKNEDYFKGIKFGEKTILSTILKMCENNKSVEDIKLYCEIALSMKCMK